jgi:SNF2 family DNA or RNA helicase
VILDHQHGQFFVHFGNMAFKDVAPILPAVKDVPGRRYHVESRRWYLPADAVWLERMIAIGFKPSQTAEDCLRALRPNIVVSKPPKPASDPELPGFLPYQVEGVHWLLNTWQQGRSAVLADDMGLGKTVQALGFLLKSGALPALVVCPASVKYNWEVEAKKWIRNIRTCVLEGQQPGPVDPDADLVIINYDVLAFEDPTTKQLEQQRKLECEKAGRKYKPKPAELIGWYLRIAQQHFKTVICDEVQYLTNPESFRSRACLYLAGHNPDHQTMFIMMSGTPIKKKPAEFWTTLHIVAPRVFPAYYAYLYKYCDPRKGYWGWTFDGLTNGDQLDAHLAKIMLRRRKIDVLTQLPPKRKVIVPMELDPLELKRYRDACSEFLVWLIDQKDAEINENEADKHITKLRQLAYAAKRNAAIQWVKDYLETGESIVVFTRHTMVIQDLLHVFKKWKPVMIDGGVTAINRQKAVEDFQARKTPVFLGQIKAAGAGITLTAAPATCFMEFGDTPDEHAQAEDRVHRIGQTADSVLAYYLAARGTVEDDMLANLESGYALASRVLDKTDTAQFFGQQLRDFNAGIIAAFRKRIV